MKHIFILFTLFFSYTISIGQPILPGAARTEQYIGLLKNKRVAIFANQTSTVKKVHLVDLLLEKGIQIKKIFAPEHGFRGTSDAGELFGNTKDSATGITVISLYGKKTKPSAEDLQDVDVMIFDIQDVGVRFFTFISSLEDYMEAAIENDKPLIILDRPNPNGFYVDGPVLDKSFRSFIGRQSVPVVYGMTIGEYARMLLREGWLTKLPKYDFVNIDNKQDKRILMQSQIPTQQFTLTIITCTNYTHKSKFTIPVKPSPNLPDMASIYLYPSTCFFEGTVMSEGRGTDKPFQLFGHPSLPKTLISFTPHSRAGAKTPKFQDQVCYGWDLSGTPQETLKKVNNRIQLKWLLEAYRLFPDKQHFFRTDGFFNLLAGNDVLMKQIQAGKTEAAIRESWQPLLQQFKKIRKKYLLYEDFE